MAKKAKKTRKIIRKTTEAKHEVEKSMKPERVVGKKQIPAGVMIIAIMGFISCAIFLIGGIIFILGGIIFSINPINPFWDKFSSAFHFIYFYQSC